MISLKVYINASVDLEWLFSDIFSVLICQTSNVQLVTLSLFDSVNQEKLETI
jgi:hypothetical protein